MINKAKAKAAAAAAAIKNTKTTVKPSQTNLTPKIKKTKKVIAQKKIFMKPKTTSYSFIPRYELRLNNIK